MAKKRRKLVIRDSRRTFGRIALLLLAVALVAGATIATVFLVKSCGVLLSVRTMQFDASNRYYGTGDGILYMRGGSLNFYSFDDEDKNYSIPLEGEPDGLIGSPGVKAVYSKSAVQIVNAPFNIETDGEIDRVKCGTKHVAVYKKRADGGYELRIYTNSGQQVLQLPSGDSASYYTEGQLMDFGFGDKNGSVLWTMELSTASGSPRTTVTVYDLDRMTNSGIITLQGQLIERMIFTDSGIYAVGTESLIRCSSADNREKYRVQIYGYRVEDVTLAGGSPSMLLVPREGWEGFAGSGTARLLTVSEKDVADETSVTVRLPEGTVDCCMVNGMLAAVTQNAVELYTVSGKAAGSLKERLELGPTPVTSVQKLDEHHILIERSGELTLLTVGK